MIADFRLNIENNATNSVREDPVIWYIDGVVRYIASCPIILVSISRKDIIKRDGKYDYLDNFSDAWEGMKISKYLILTSVILSLCFLCYEVCGLLISKESSSLSRSMYDSCSTVVVWGASLIIHWEKFSVVELIGFLVIVTGTSLHNHERENTEYINYMEAKEVVEYKSIEIS